MENLGVESSKILCDEARMLAGRSEVMCITLQESGLSMSAFDAVTFWEWREDRP